MNFIKIFLKMNKLIIPFILLAFLSVVSCSDHDDPKLSPIDTSKVKITANVSATPSVNWLNPTEELTVRVADVDMSAPKGVVLRSVSLMVEGREWQQKPFSGEAVEFKIPLNHLPLGRVNFAVWGGLIQKNSRDADIIIADNIQKIIFSETPEFDCEATVDVAVKSVSTSGEEHSHSFQVKSTDGSTIELPSNELYWTPESGTAQTLELTLTASAKAVSTNSTLQAKVDRVYWNGTESETLRLTIPNSVGSLKGSRMVQKDKIMLIVGTVRFGTFENVTVDESPLTYIFSLMERD